MHAYQFKSREKKKKKSILPFTKENLSTEKALTGFDFYRRKMFSLENLLVQESRYFTVKYIIKHTYVHVNKYKYI